MFFHEFVERSGADVLVEVERGNSGEVELGTNEFRINRLHRSAGGKAKHRAVLARYQPRNDARCGAADVLRSGNDDYFHGASRASTSFANRSTRCRVQRTMSSVGSFTSGVRSIAYSTALAPSTACESRNVAFARLRPAAARS